MSKLITTVLLVILLGVSGMSLSACDQGNNGDRSAPGTAPNTPSQDVPGGSTPGGGGMGAPNGGQGS